MLCSAVRDARLARLPGAGGRDDAAAWLGQRVSADFEVAPEILRITAQGADEREALALASAVCDAYPNMARQMEDHRRRARLGDLAKVYVTYQEMVRGQREAIRRLQDALGRDAHGVNLRLARQRLDAVHRELLQAQAQLRRGRIELGLLRGRQPGRAGAGGGGGTPGEGSSLAVAGADPERGTRAAVSGGPGARRGGR